MPSFINSIRDNNMGEGVHNNSMEGDSSLHGGMPHTEAVQQQDQLETG